MLDIYEINESTLAIIPITKKTSRIIEENNIYLINQNTTDIIDHSCKYFGSSYEGRHEGTKSLTGLYYKTPILIEETREIIFFPTNSPRLDNCYWISFKKIKDSKIDNNLTKIIFENNLEISIDISYQSLQNQILRSSLLESIIRRRKY